MKATFLSFRLVIENTIDTRVVPILFTKQLNESIVFDIFSLERDMNLTL